MSKNVAVFVDVANIFYAAKAAGVDIDYVTLLKSAIAGRDFVRAYAYTGLDPENENQRQFHNFLARNGYKVISKDIRKYGDGRIKANLDIELVVDMMRMARNLDIAVVVSGDGDFAPAIRAVQQMGVRVEVISFRGNTSSDLIEVADTFTDIAQIARVEKGSARSGRRVAAEGDLSMTEVPEKETEGAPRRRRGGRGRGEREEAATPVAAAEAATAALPGNLIVLPGERLSRAPDETPDEMPGEEEAAAAAEGEGLPIASEDGGEDGADGRRRRRRRGGRGRGRARREMDTELPVAAGAGGEEDEEEDDFEDLAPAQPPIHTFGSVWDSQLGVPSVPIASAGPAPEDEDEDYEDEPEIPEYLLAERRQRGQRGQRGRMGGRGRGAGYQAAVERERFGRAGAGSFGAVRQPDRQRGDRGRGPRPQQGQRQGRPERAPREARAQERQGSAGSSAQPWSEVPPEIEELLRAELARQGSRPGSPGLSGAPGGDSVTADAATDAELELASAEAPAVENVVDEATEAAAGKPRTTRRRTTKAAAGEATSAEAAAKPARTTRRRATATTEPVADDGQKPKRAPRSRRTAAASGQPSAGAGDEAAGDVQSAEPEAPAKPVRRRRARTAEPVGGEGTGEGTGEA